jgi:tRNA threonylcarbamoyl adenosine modification protein (Sua5/YciO/YrdC/YwlC family)
LASELLKLDSRNPDPRLVQYVADRIRAGEVLGVPTDTFYGLAADPVNLRAVERIYEIKTRSKHKPLSLLIDTVDQAQDLGRDLPEVFFTLANRFWPGPLTIIVRASSWLPLKVTANTGNVALRVPAAEVPLAIVKALRFPVTATSANLSGAAECTTAECVREQLGDSIQMIVNGGPTPNTLPTTIVDLSGSPPEWQILRDGAVPHDQVSEILWS